MSHLVLRMHTAIRTLQGDEERSSMQKFVELTRAAIMISTSSLFSTTPVALRLYASMYLRKRASGSALSWERPAAVTISTDQSLARSVNMF
jgi:hypothetical protein